MGAVVAFIKITVFQYIEKGRLSAPCFLPSCKNTVLVFARKLPFSEGSFFDGK